MIAVCSQDGTSNAETIVESDHSFHLERGVSVARGIVRLKLGKSHVFITNFTDEYQHLNKDSFIAFPEEIHEESDVIAVAAFHGESEERLLIASTCTRRYRTEKKSSGIAAPIPGLFSVDLQVTTDAPVIADMERSSFVVNVLDPKR